MLMLNDIRRKPALSALTVALFFGTPGFCIRQEGVSLVHAAELVEEGLRKDQKSDAAPEPAEAEIAPDKGMVLIVPFDNEDGMAVAAIMADTIHGGGDIFAAFRKGEPQQYGTIVEPIFAVWASGRIRWMVDHGKYREDHVSPNTVSSALSSIETEKHNTPRNTRCSYLGTRPKDREYEDYWVLFVSTGRNKNIVFGSYLHAWREACHSLDEGKGLSTESKPMYFRSDSRTWSEFRVSGHEEVPSEFIEYLDTWDSLRSRLMSLIPEESSAKEININKTRQICYSYRFDEKTSEWVREIPRDSCRDDER